MRRDVTQSPLILASAIIMVQTLALRTLLGPGALPDRTMSTQIHRTALDPQDTGLRVCAGHACAKASVWRG
jgi:hypothetical protein